MDEWYYCTETRADMADSDAELAACPTLIENNNDFYTHMFGILHIKEFQEYLI